MRFLPKCAFLAGLGAMAAAPVSASSAEASNLRYENQGEYMASFEVRWNRDGQKCSARSFDDKGEIPMGSQVKIDLTQKLDLLDGERSVCLTGGKIPEGTEVWGLVEIAVGPSRSCRKDKKVIYQPSGGMMKYYSKGYWQNNNRCRVEDWP